MENVIQNVTCLVDSLAVVGYGSMIVMVCLSSVTPSLVKMASHGKTRSVPQQQQQQQSLNKMTPFTTNKERGGFFHVFVDGDFFLVPKRRFRDFYVVGLLCLTTTQWLAFQRTEQPPTTTTASPWLIPISTALLYLHLFRRLYECTFVHQWCSTSQMHVTGYLVGAIHYLWLPMVFIRLPCADCLHNMLGDRLPSALSSQYTNDAAGGPRVTPPPPQQDVNYLLPLWIWRLPPILLCLWAQYQQHMHHLILANHGKPKNSSFTTTTIQNTPTTSRTYSLPTGGWFRYVTCPHFFAEILVYVSFAMLLEQEEQVYGMRHFIVLWWVASNLTMSAMINYAWYTKNLPKEAMNGRKAIFPFIL